MVNDRDRVILSRFGIWCAAGISSHPTKRWREAMDASAVDDVFGDDRLCAVIESAWPNT